MAPECLSAVYTSAVIWYNRTIGKRTNESETKKIMATARVIEKNGTYHVTVRPAVGRWLMHSGIDVVYVNAYLTRHGVKPSEARWDRVS